MKKLHGKYIYLILGIAVLLLMVFYLFKSPGINSAGYTLSIITIIAGLVFLRGVLTNKIHSSVVSAQVIIGIIFLFSGFVKAVDPMGTMFKITDYFTAFNLDFLKPASLFIAFILCCYEFPLGFSILLGLKGKLMTRLLLLIMIPFTLLTFYLALKNPVTDCGCFGDALILTNWETFFKNLVIMVFVSFLFQHKNSIKPMIIKINQWVAVGLGILIILFVSIYSYMYLPIMDFRPYKTGKDIYLQTIIPEGEQTDIYETILVYKNNQTGEIKEFDIDHIPVTEEWQWQETINKLIKKGFKPPIHDFRIADNSGNDLTSVFLQQSGYRLLIIQNKLEESNSKSQKLLNQLVREILTDEEIVIWALTSDLKESQISYIKTNNLPYSFYLADPVMLKTIIRSNPGLLLLKDNLILKKWPARRIPSKSEVYKNLYK